MQISARGVTCVFYGVIAIRLCCLRYPPFLMQKIFIRWTHVIRYHADHRHLRATKDDQAFTFEVATSNAGAPVEVTLDPQTGRVHGVSHRHVSDALVEYLSRVATIHVSHFPADIASEVHALKESLSEAAKQVVELFKYFLGKTAIQDDVISEWTDVHWSFDGNEFRIFPTVPTISSSGVSGLPLSKHVGEQLQEAMSNGYRPLVGERHLYRAIQEPVPRFKWIDATMAAELCVKEALVRKNPQLEALMLHMPSPPLTKLYGEILKIYMGEKSPYVKELDAGMSRRNKLVHRPEGEVVTIDMANTYIRNVTDAIHHLYGLLYPGWELTKSLKMIHIIP